MTLPEFFFCLLLSSFTDFYERFNFLSLIFARQRLLLLFSLEILRGKLARGRPKLIPSRMPNRVSAYYRFWAKKVSILVSRLIDIEVCRVKVPCSKYTEKVGRSVQGVSAFSRVLPLQFLLYLFMTFI